MSTPYAVPPLKYDGLGLITPEEFVKFDDIQYAYDECAMQGSVEIKRSGLHGLGLFTTAPVLRGDKIGNLWGITVERMSEEYTAALASGKLVGCALTMTNDYQPLEFVASTGCACGYINASPVGASEFLDTLYIKHIIYN